MITSLIQTEPCKKSWGNTQSEKAPSIGRESMGYDVVVVGAGPAGLATAIRIKDRAAAAGMAIPVAVLEKGSEPGAHILSESVVVDPKALSELIPDWQVIREYTLRRS